MPEFQTVVDLSETITLLRRMVSELEAERDMLKIKIEELEGIPGHKHEKSGLDSHQKQA